MSAQSAGGRKEGGDGRTDGQTEVCMTGCTE